ncbi:hypothetical protein MCERHM31_01228 [Methylophilaceae bacterium]
MTKNLIVLYPYQCNKFIDNLLELDYFRKFTNVEVWDLRKITGKLDSKNYYHDCNFNYDLTNNSIFIFIINIFKLRIKSSKEEYFILNELNYRSPSQLFCNLIITLLLRKSKVKVIELCNGGHPYWYKLSDEVQKESKKSTLEKVYILFSKNKISFSIQVAWEYCIAKLGKLFPRSTTHILVAGSQSQYIADRTDHLPIRLFGHTQDYSNVLTTPNYLNGINNLVRPEVIYLDQAMPAFPIDAHLPTLNTLTRDIWYPALNHFFKLIESTDTVTTKIAGHYKTKHNFNEPLFDYREVIYGETRNLISKCKFVVACYSTSISYAIIYRKPIVFIYSDQYLLNPILIRHIFGLAAMLGCKPINIDHFTGEISDYLNIDESKYLNYERVVLSSKITQRPNFQVILEDVMKIDVLKNFS